MYRNIEIVLFVGFTCSSEEVWGAPYSRLHQYLPGKAQVGCLIHRRICTGVLILPLLFQCYIFLDDPYSTAQLLEKLAKGSKVRTKTGHFWLCDDPLPISGWQFSSVPVGIWSLRRSDATLLEEGSRGHTSLTSGSAQSPSHYTGRGSRQYSCAGNRRVHSITHMYASLC